MKKIRGVLVLCSVPSSPVTVVSLLLGYLTFRPSILTVGVVPLAAAGALGHWAFYAANDVFDYEWDMVDRRKDKPLVNGSLNVTEATYVSIVLGVTSLAVVIFFFPTPAIFTWIIAMALGLVYDLRSKEDVYSGLYMAGWGLVIIFTGALYAGGATFLTFMLALLLAVHMFWMTVMGNLKDIGKEEESIPEALDCKIIYDGGYPTLWTSARFNIFTAALVVLQIVILLLLPVSDGAEVSDIFFIYAGIVAGLVIWDTYNGVLYQPGFDRDRMKEDIAKHEIASVLSLLIISFSFSGPNSIVLLVLGSVVWGTTLQMVLYGNPLHFP